MIQPLSSSHLHHGDSQPGSPVLEWEEVEAPAPSPMVLEIPTKQRNAALFLGLHRSALSKAGCPQECRLELFSEFILKSAIVYTKGNPQMPVCHKRWRCSRRDFFSSALPLTRMTTGYPSLRPLKHPMLQIVYLSGPQAFRCPVTEVGEENIRFTLSYLLLFFHTGSHVAQAGLELIIKRRMTLNFWSSCPCFLNARVPPCLVFAVLGDRIRSLMHTRQALQLPHPPAPSPDLYSER